MLKITKKQPFKKYGFEKATRGQIVLFPTAFLGLKDELLVVAKQRYLCRPQVSRRRE